ncbi:hypothetical protein ACOSP7_013866 [Xanthoceras sorbifolium]
MKQCFRSGSTKNTSDLQRNTLPSQSQLRRQPIMTSSPNKNLYFRRHMKTPKKFSQRLNRREAITTSHRQPGTAKPITTIYRKHADLIIMPTHRILDMTGRRWDTKDSFSIYRKKSGLNQRLIPSPIRQFELIDQCKITKNRRGYDTKSGWSRDPAIPINKNRITTTNSLTTAPKKEFTIPQKTTPNE